MSEPDKKTKDQIQDDRLNDHWDKIERIESNIDYARFEVQEQRIEVMEKKFEEIYKSVHGIEPSKADNIWEQIAELKEARDIYSYTTLKEQIAELRDDIRVHKEEFGNRLDLVIWREYIDKNKQLTFLQTQINELKEDLKASLDYTTRWAKEFMRTEEVLRELIAVYEQETLIDMGLLEKLDSLKQTEKKELGISWEEAKIGLAPPDWNKEKKEESEKEFEFQLVEKFIPPRNIKCTDCMNNPVPELIEEFAKIMEFIELESENPKKMAREYKIKYRGRIK